MVLLAACITLDEQLLNQGVEVLGHCSLVVKNVECTIQGHVVHGLRNQFLSHCSGSEVGRHDECCIDDGKKAEQAQADGERTRHGY
mmetsp:Transcript_18899/g.44091  ORF Transcript_18899/g.44091 Transcript_18899/m.44091 type:complete len:86 (-) Transcript_18899:27-284(-)